MKVKLEIDIKDIPDWAEYVTIDNNLFTFFEFSPSYIKKTDTYIRLEGRSQEVIYPLQSLISKGQKIRLQKTKHKCPNCKGQTIPLWSHNKRMCTNCKELHDWKLKPGQKSTTIKGLVG